MSLNPTEAVLKDVSLRYRLPYRVVEKIYRCQFELLKKSMREGDKKDDDSFKVIYLMRFGRFVPNYASMYGYRKREEERKRKRDEQG